MDRFDGRVLLTPALQEIIPERLLLVSLMPEPNDESICFVMIAPGLSGQSLGQVRQALCQYLSRTVAALYPEGARSTEFESEDLTDACNGSTAVALVAKPSLMGDKTEAVVLDLVRAFMKARGGSAGLYPIALGSQELSVPLVFQPQNVAGENVYLVALPQDLSFPDCACASSRRTSSGILALERELTAVLRRRNCDLRRVKVSDTHEGVQIKIFFNHGGQLEVSTLEMVKCIVAQTLTLHAMRPGGHRLSFTPLP